MTSVDKANVLESSRLWRQIAIEVGGELPGRRRSITSWSTRRRCGWSPQPATFDVVVTENMFGDILTDEAAVLAGSLGMLPSASLGDGALGLYEPIHGSAPDIAGQGHRQPARHDPERVRMLLRHSLGLDAEAVAVERAVERALAVGRAHGGSQGRGRAVDERDD